MGYSFGGYYAPRIAAFERRYAACVCLGALHWDLHAWQSKIREQLKADPKKSAQSNFQFQWILGLNDSDAALERAKQFSLDGVADKITCPVLITHGANDRVVPVEAAHKLHAALTTPKRTLKSSRRRKAGRALPGGQPAARDRLYCRLDHGEPLISPYVPIAVSKLARFADIDREDILELARNRLITARSLRGRAEAALPYYVGNLIPVRTSIDIACRDIESLERASKRKRNRERGNQPSRRETP